MLFISLKNLCVINDKTWRNEIMASNHYVTLQGCLYNPGGLFWRTQLCVPPIIGMVTIKIHNEVISGGKKESCRCQCTVWTATQKQKCCCQWVNAHECVFGWAGGQAYKQTHALTFSMWIFCLLFNWLVSLKCCGLWPKLQISLADVVCKWMSVLNNLQHEVMFSVPFASLSVCGQFCI